MRRSEAHFRRLVLKRSAEAITLLCPAKVNLFLRVLGQRADGFHEIVTLMQAISLCDELTVERTPCAIECLCSEPSLEGPRNLAYRATQRFLDRIGSGAGVRLRLKKRIPVAAGLGGGSSDAASALLALRHLFRCALSFSDLTSLAAEIGSDVPFFLTGGVALCRGRGERVEPWRDLARVWVILVMCDQRVSARAAYEGLKSSLIPARSRSSLRVPSRQAIRLDAPSEWFRNDLEPAVFELVPGLRQLKDEVEQLSARQFLVSGSGPTLFALCGGLAEGKRVLMRLRRHLGARARVTLAANRLRTP